nr:MAG TPA: hypothetical protein [Caudoviricetes sp.]
MSLHSLYEVMGTKSIVLRVNFYFYIFVDRLVG